MQGLKAGSGQQGGHRPPMARRARVTTEDGDWGILLVFLAPIPANQITYSFQRC